MQASRAVFDDAPGFVSSPQRYRYGDLHRVEIDDNQLVAVGVGYRGPPALSDDRQRAAADGRRLWIGQHDGLPVNAKSTWSAAVSVRVEGTDGAAGPNYLSTSAAARIGGHAAAARACRTRRIPVTRPTELGSTAASDQCNRDDPADQSCDSHDLLQRPLR